MLPVIAACRMTLPSAVLTIEFTLKPSSLTVLLAANGRQVYFV